MKTCSTAFQVIAIMITLLSNKWSTKLSTIAGKLDDVSICTSTTKSVPRDFSLIENYKMVYYMAWKLSSQFLIFNPWKYPWNWIAFYQNSFVISPGLLCHLIRRDSGRLANGAFTSNPNGLTVQKLQTVLNGFDFYRKTLFVTITFLF